MTERKKGGGPFLALFGGISLLFLTILLVAYYFAKKANPVLLDDQGKPRQTQHS
jgi:hypothetical protein